MQWHYLDDGEWTAYSRMQDDGINFVWRIKVTENGLFSVSDSDSELTTREEPFNTLHEACAYCKEMEDVYI